MNDADDEMKQAQEEMKRKMEAASGKKDQKEEDEDTGEHTMPERDIGSQRKATSSSRTPSNEM